MHLTESQLEALKGWLHKELSTREGIDMLTELSDYILILLQKPMEGDDLYQHVLGELESFMDHSESFVKLLFSVLKDGSYAQHRDDKDRQINTRRDSVDEDYNQEDDMDSNRRIRARNSNFDENNASRVEFSDDYNARVETKNESVVVTHDEVVTNEHNVAMQNKLYKGLSSDRYESDNHQNRRRRPNDSNFQDTRRNERRDRNQPPRPFFPPHMSMPPPYGGPPMFDPMHPFPPYGMMPPHGTPPNHILPPMHGGPNAIPPPEWFYPPQFPGYPPFPPHGMYPPFDTPYGNWQQPPPFRQGGPHHKAHQKQHNEQSTASMGYKVPEIGSNQLKVASCTTVESRNLQSSNGIPSSLSEEENTEKNFNKRNFQDQEYGGWKKPKWQGGYQSNKNYYDKQNQPDDFQATQVTNGDSESGIPSAAADIDEKSDVPQLPVNDGKITKENIVVQQKYDDLQKLRSKVDDIWKKKESLIQTQIDKIGDMLNHLDNNTMLQSNLESKLVDLQTQLKEVKEQREKGTISQQIQQESSPYSSGNNFHNPGRGYRGRGGGRFGRGSGGYTRGRGGYGRGMGWKVSQPFERAATDGNSNNNINENDTGDHEGGDETLGQME